MNRSLLFVTGILLVVTTNFTSCKKDPAAPAYFKVKSLYDEGVTTNFTYDKHGRLISANSSDGTGDTYSYSPGFVTEMRYDSTFSTPWYYDVIVLNNKGTMVADSVYYDGSYAGLETFTYDVAGHINQAYDEAGNMQLYTYVGDNLASYGLFFPTQHEAHTTAFTYTNIIDNQDYGQYYLGKESKNLVSTEFISETSTLITHTYEFDNLGRIVTEKLTPGKGGYGHETITYSY